MNAVSREFELALAERNAVRLDTVLPCGPANERAPAAADIQQPLACRKPQLAADVVQLVALSLLQRVGFALEVGT